MPRHQITAEASRKGRDARAAKSVHLAWLVYKALWDIERNEGIALTLAGIADRLNRRGLRTNRGNLFDFRKVGAVLDKMGLDRVAIQRWKQVARDRASEWKVAPEPLYLQLWFQWQKHVASSQEPFIPALDHPDEWRRKWAMALARQGGGTFPVEWIYPTLQAKLVNLFLGVFEDQEP